MVLCSALPVPQSLLKTSPGVMLITRGGSISTTPLGSEEDVSCLYLPDTLPYVITFSDQLFTIPASDQRWYGRNEDQELRTGAVVLL